MVRTVTDEEQICILAHEWRERIESDNVTAADKAAFERWLDADLLHVQAWERSQTLIAAYNQLTAEDIDADLLDEASRIDGWAFWDGLGRALRSRTAFLAASAAALVLVAVPAALTVLPLGPGSEAALVRVSTTYSTGVGETRSYDLVDGSHITIGPQTIIDVDLTETSRLVDMHTGAAVFEVAKDPDRRFSVTAGDLTAAALGTVFEVRNNGGVQRVAVSEGAVQVSYPIQSGERTSGMRTGERLDAGEQVAATLEGGLREVKDVALSNVGAWRDARLVYDGGTIAELVADANRYTDRAIVLDETLADLGGETITASFDAADREGMLETLAYVFPLRVDRSDPDELVLRREEAGPDGGR